MRLGGRLKRTAQGIITTAALSVSRPRPRNAAVVTLNPDEENATVQAILLGKTDDVDSITLISPSPEVSRIAVSLAARNLGHPVPKNIRYLPLKYSSLLRQYMVSSETYSTHVLLPGSDRSGRRRHVHLTHGSGPKPDTTYRSPANVLASITPEWVPQQLLEYKLPANTEVVSSMPRLEVMRRAVGDSSVLMRLGLPPDRELIVWAPTYRKILRGSELRVSGEPIQDSLERFFGEILEVVKARNGTLVVKKHPQEADSYSSLGAPVFTNASLRDRQVTPYELFGAAGLVITDYSSIYVERDVLGLERLLVCPDVDEFRTSYRGFRS